MLFEKPLLARTIQNQQPLILWLQIPSENGLIYHHVVVAGYDAASSELLIHDPVQSTEWVLEQADGGPFRTTFGAPWVKPQMSLGDLCSIYHCTDYGISDPKDLIVGIYTLTPWQSNVIPPELRVHGESPIELLVTDPRGRRVGFDPTTGQVAEMANASYYAQGWSSLNPPERTALTKVVEFTQPIEGAYRIDVVGTGVGPFTVSLFSSGAATRFHGEVTPGEVHQFDFYYSSKEGVVTTPPTPPTVGAGESGPVGSTFARLGAPVTPNGWLTEAWFEWGQDSRLADIHSTDRRAVGNGRVGQLTETAISILSPDTTYYFRVAAENAAGVLRGPIAEFRTLPSGVGQSPYSLALSLHDPVRSGSNQFGSAMALNAGTILIGDPAEAQEGAPLTNHGAAYLYDARTGALIRRLSHPDPPSGEVGNGDFGWDMAAVGSGYVVTDPQDDTVDSNAGIAYLFDGATGQLTRRFFNPNPKRGETLGAFENYFGRSVASLGGKIVVGAPAAPNRGAVYVFDSQTAALLLTIPNPIESANVEAFGYSVATIGNKILVGAPGSNRRVGSVFLFDGDTGQLLLAITDPSRKIGSDFGYSVAGVENRIVVGAPASNTSDPGAVYVFDVSGQVQRVLHKLVPNGNDYFGYKVATIGDSFLVSSPSNDRPLGGLGAAVYLIDGGSGQIRWIFSPDTAAGDFGGMTSLSSAVFLGVSRERVLLYDICGNGIVTAGEQCDDGNLVDGDGCQHDCRLPACGNGILDVGEECDDGNALDGDGCDRNCQTTRCGNGVAAAGEECDDGNAINDDGCGNDCRIAASPRCGDGVVASSEGCDDGDLIDGDGCDRNCTITGCGNGIVTAGEECDDWSRVGGDGCSAVCTLEARCGNGILDAGEQCDDGNLVNGDGCSAVCSLEARCGNGILDAGEQCDDGNLVNGDGCESDCTLPRCGNGIPDAGEQCDDGNLLDGDSCESDCTLPRCGNGIRDAGEQCDDGNLVNGDSCESDCTLPRCGNGIPDAGEQCDDGNLVNGDSCESDCTLPRCGNGIPDAGEQCDDGNLVNGDSCESDCTLPRCGNGIPDAGEQCDDGNLVNGDGCESDCTAATLWQRHPRCRGAVRRRQPRERR